MIATLIKCLIRKEMFHLVECNGRILHCNRNLLKFTNKTYEPLLSLVLIQVAAVPIVKRTNHIDLDLPIALLRSRRNCDPFICHDKTVTHD